MTIDELYCDYQRALSHGARQWTDWSGAAFDRRREVIRGTQQQLQVLSAGESSNARTRLDASLLSRELRLDREAIDYRLHAFPINQLMGVPNQTSDGMRIPFFLTVRHPLVSLEDLDALIELVEASEIHLLQMAAAVREGARNGITLPREAIAATRVVIQDSLSGISATRGSEEHPIPRRFTQWAASALGISPAKIRSASDRLGMALAGPFLRGYAAIGTAVDEMSSHQRTSFGVWELPDGPEFYRHCLERWSGSALSADALHQLGLSEIRRIQSEIRALPAVDDKSSGETCYPDSPAGAAAYIERARLLVGMAVERLDRVTTWRPRASFEIRAVEPSRQRGALYAEFYPASVDGRQPSLYYINGSDMSRLPKAELAALSFHESVPGHHLQLCTTQERDDLAAFRRRPFLYESYCEGWAMYAEQLGCELLADILTPAEQRGCLTRRLWMAARVAVDTGIHALRWSRAEAIRFFLANTFAPAHMIEQEVDRLSVWPAQATAYHLGYLAFSELRHASGGSMGGKSSMSEFHDRLFRLGPVPPGMLKLYFAQEP